MESELAELKKIVADLTAQLEALRGENRLLKQKVQVLLRKLYGPKSEKLSADQLQLLLQLGEVVVELPSDKDPEDPQDPPPARRRRKGRDSKQTLRVPDDLPVIEEVIDPEEVQAEPEAYELIGQEEVKELDLIPQQFYWRRIVRRKWVSKKDRQRPPLIASARRRFLEAASYASPGLVADILVKKYDLHLPLYRQEQELKLHHQIHLSRKTMAQWVRVAADWLTPAYETIGERLRGSGYLQIDESPNRYLGREGGGSALGYLWAYHHPGGDVLFEWHTGRGTKCLSRMLDAFSGIVQSDGYVTYLSYLADRPEIVHAGCWSHARRGFFEAKEEDPSVAAWFLQQIGLLYEIEADLRQAGASARLRQARRAGHSRRIVDRIEKALKRKLPAYLPRSGMGKAIAYALNHYERLRRFLDEGRIEIDNNLTENRFRPNAIGKRNYLFIGHPEAGQRSAVLYTIMASCRRLGINPREYLRDVLERLPSLTRQQAALLTPEGWLAEKAAQRQAQAA